VLTASPIVTIRGRGHATGAANVRERPASGNGQRSDRGARRRETENTPTGKWQSWSRFPSCAAHGRQWAAFAESAIRRFILPVTGISVHMTVW